MRNELKIIFFIFIIIISCSTSKRLIIREKNSFGTVKYYVQTDLDYYDNFDHKIKKRIIVKVNNSIYYSIYYNRIYKHTKQEKQLGYTLIYDEIPKKMNTPKYYQKISKLDSLVLAKSDKILDSLKWNDFKRAKGATAFRIEVFYYHGFPKNEKFGPY